MSTNDQRVKITGAGQASISLQGVDQFALLGTNDANLRLMQESIDGKLNVRNDKLTVACAEDKLGAVVDAVLRLLDLLGREKSLDEITVRYVFQRSLDDEEDASSLKKYGETLYFAETNRRAIRARTKGQQDYVEAIRENDCVFAIGPAGSGKTYLAVVMAMDYLQRGLVERIVLVRPAVEAGEQLGFLPGDLQEKINPYLRPLYDALSDTIGPSRIQKYMASGVIESAPLGYMRGRTLNNAFVILDEAQNTTRGQMKMFLTRLGYESKAVVTGDITQIDLDIAKASGLIQARHILRDIEGIAFMELTPEDVVRHPLVRKIIEAFRIDEDGSD
jgi:phosphate starvation-inducible protein PhoH and related proteins